MGIPSFFCGCEYPISSIIADSRAVLQEIVSTGVCDPDQIL